MGSYTGPEDEDLGAFGPNSGNARDRSRFGTVVPPATAEMARILKQVNEPQYADVDGLRVEISGVGSSEVPIPGNHHQASADHGRAQDQACSISTAPVATHSTATPLRRTDQQAWPHQRSRLGSG